jgi:hypothetical protein
MKKTWRAGRIQSLLAIVALAAAAFAAPSATLAAASAKHVKKPVAPGAPHLERTSAINRFPVVPVTPVGSKVRGTLPPIELNVDTTSPDATASVFTFGTDITVKLAFGNRFTLTDDQAPFSLQAVGALLAQLDDGTGFEPGEMVGITIFLDPASTGNISNATAVFNGAVTLSDVNAIIVFPLPQPIIVKQGDIYIIFTDLSTDAEDTPVPVVQPDNGGSSDPRAFISTNQDTAPDPLDLTGYIRADIVQLPGNVIVRGYGDNAPAGSLFTGTVPPTDASLPGTGNTLTATGTSQVTLSWQAPVLPSIAESESNNSASGCQVVPFNQVINGSVKSSDPGTDIGGGNFEDWYCFTVPAGGATVTIDLLDDGGKDIDLFLFPKSGPFDPSNPLASSANDCGAHELIDGIQLPAGDYVVAVDAFGPRQDDCEATSTTPYKLIIIGPGGVRLTGYNVYCGSSMDFTADANSFIGTVGPSTTGLVIRESAVGAFYRVAAVYGDMQATPSDAVTGSPCEGGPTFTKIKVKRNGNGSISLKGGTGDLTGVTLTINGVGFATPPKVKASKHSVKQKGPLANGQTVGQACPVGCTIQVQTNAGCSTVTAP